MTKTVFIAETDCSQHVYSTREKAVEYIANEIGVMAKCALKMLLGCSIDPNSEAYKKCQKICEEELEDEEVLALWDEVLEEEDELQDDGWYEITPHTLDP